VQRDLDQGRSVLNFSEWNRAQAEAGEAAEAIQEGEMPMRAYLLTHAAARLSDSERQSLIRGLAATLGTENAQEGHGEREEEE
jgi:hypothetical protein